MDGLEDYTDIAGDGGVLKKVIQAGDATDGFPPPKSLILLHYEIGLRQQDGTFVLVDRSRDRGEAPFDFYLAQPNQVLKGWDMAVAGMVKGEVASVICRADYALGEKGAMPKFPPNATIEATLDLLSFEPYKPDPVAIRPASNETDDERMARWKKEIADGTSPLLQDLGLKELAEKAKNKGGSDPYRWRRKPENAPEPKVVETNSAEYRAMLSQQVLQGYAEDYRYMERAAYMDLYIDVPEGTRAKDIECTVRPRHVKLSANGAVVLDRELKGRVDTDGSMWEVTTYSLQKPKFNKQASQEDQQRGAMEEGALCVHLYLDKKSPDDTVWGGPFKPTEEEKERLRKLKEQAQGKGWRPPGPKSSNDEFRLPYD